MLAETVSRAVGEVKACVDLAAEEGKVLMFRLAATAGLSPASM